MDDAEATNPTELQEGGNLSLRSELAEVMFMLQLYCSQV